jgi:hypothetical protein
MLFAILNNDFFSLDTQCHYVQLLLRGPTGQNVCSAFAGADVKVNYLNDDDVIFVVRA